MEDILVKPRYADYFSRGTSCPLTTTPGYCTIFTRDRFLAIWKFWYVVDEQDDRIDKTDNFAQLLNTFSESLALLLSKPDAVIELRNVSIQRQADNKTALQR